MSFRWFIEALGEDYEMSAQENDKYPAGEQAPAVAQPGAGPQSRYMAGEVPDLDRPYVALRYHYYAREAVGPFRNREECLRYIDAQADPSVWSYLPMKGDRDHG